MESELTNEPEEQFAAETPEDVAILYSWANLHGAKYRDFSASRREYRAQIRHKAAEELRRAELLAKEEAEAAAAQAERIAREAEEAANRSSLHGPSHERSSALQVAEENARRAQAERVEASRRAEAAAMAEAAARREEQEIADAHSSAQRQAARYADSEMRRRARSGPQPVPVLPGQMEDPYVSQQPPVEPYQAAEQRAQVTQLETNRRSNETGLFTLPERSGARAAYVPEVRRRPQGYRPDESSGTRSAFRPDKEPVRQEIAPRNFDSGPYDRQISDRTASERSRYERPAADRLSQDRLNRDRQSYDRPEYARQDFERQDYDRPLRGRTNTEIGPDANQDSFDREDPAGPAWLYAQPQAPRGQAPQGTQRFSPSVADTLQHSRERVASRWYALKGVFDGQEAEQQPEEPRQRELRTPLLAIFSLSGGVGKTSLVATLGRSLSSMGEKVLLADTTSHGLLPYYFGASELRPGVVRTFSPPSGSTDAPIHLVSYEVDNRSNDRAAQDAFADQVTKNGQGAYRLLFDVNAQNGRVIRRLARLSPTILVPVAPDMNSVISLQAVERYFHTAVDGEGRALQPYYVLNQFDPSLPLHLDVREVLQRQLGDRLLSIVIRRSPAVSEALAEGMTVVDYAPEAQVAEDYLGVATWLRGVAPPVASGFRTVRWSER